LKGDTCTSFNVLVMLIVHWCIIFIWSELSDHALKLRCWVHCMSTTLSLEKVHEHINFIYFINTQWIPCFRSSLTHLLSLEHKFSHPIVWHLTIMSCACCCKLHKLVINQFASTMFKVLQKHKFFNTDFKCDRIVFHIELWYEHDVNFEWSYMLVSHGTMIGKCKGKW